MNFINLQKWLKRELYVNPLQIKNIGVRQSPGKTQWMVDIILDAMVVITMTIDNEAEVNELVSNFNIPRGAK